MFAQQLIGKKALRTKPTVRGCTSFTTDPITILAATECHIVFRWEGSMGDMTNHEPRILNTDYTDNNWISYDDLMALADEKHIDLMMKLNA